MYCRKPGKAPFPLYASHEGGLPAAILLKNLKSDMKKILSHFPIDFGLFLAFIIDITCKIQDISILTVLAQNPVFHRNQVILFAFRPFSVSTLLMKQRIPPHSVLTITPDESALFASTL